MLNNPFLRVSAPWASWTGQAPRAGAPPHAPDREFLQHLLLRTYASGLVELHASPSPFSTEVGDCPRAFSLARFHARRGSTIPTLRHSTVEVQDQLARRLIELLDGTRDREALLRDLGPPVRLEDLDRNLAKLARMALLEGA